MLVRYSADYKGNKIKRVNESLADFKKFKKLKEASISTYYRYSRKLHIVDAKRSDTDNRLDAIQCV
ncbi:hypothetical protein AGMMS5026_09890 [Endomicrobiia bacterium]|nr:hypothetical protein AGMMS49523_08160 [Endomicrobiia bacterium]GHT12591.1 hypothetical protein AGMMS49571_04830 [Endomicrobiia bacterium]GHT20690.1 hypothetical protein AGMMS49929_08030 [Endomicrobiia bacterium]GHT27244.1 hypothetical protein AGMMS49995_05790 [Endomicrobiia bacterium]GHT32209.1 hypothetical protein AGMMS5026_09890 [Endomicrobiia bacterium]